MTDWLSEFNQDGFAIARGIARLDTVEALRSAFGDPDAGAGITGRAGAVYAKRRALAIPAVRSWATSGAASELACAVLGAGAQPVRAILFDKRPEANWPVAWHQDVTVAVRERREVEGYGPWSVKAGVPHVQPPAAVLERMVTVRLHLDDCPPSNGALRVVAGSHRPGKRTPAGVREAVRAGRHVTCAARAGDAVLMRPLLLHSSAPSEAPRHRRVVHVEYASAPLAGGLGWAEATFGEPDPQGRPT